MMKARVVVFPIRGRNWCFSRSIDTDPTNVYAQSANSPSTFMDLWRKLSSSSSPEKKTLRSNVELVVDFVANKMNKGWTNLGKAPQGSFKNKMHGFGIKLLSRVKPSEIFLKSIPQEVTKVEIMYPSSLNPRLVRRRLRHIAFRGTVMHRQFFYGSATLLPLTSVFMVLPLPNIPFFWILFRTYSHWRALQGSEKLLQLVSYHSTPPDSSTENVKGNENKPKSDEVCENSVGLSLVLQPSEELQKLLHLGDADDDLSKCTISKICQKFNLNTMDVVKYRDSM